MFTCAHGAFLNPKGSKRNLTAIYYMIVYYDALPKLNLLCSPKPDLRVIRRGLPSRPSLPHHAAAPRLGDFQEMQRGQGERRLGV